MLEARLSATHDGLVEGGKDLSPSSDARTIFGENRVELILLATREPCIWFSFFVLMPSFARIRAGDFSLFSDLLGSL